ncbi:hypothetical protein ACQKJZ_04390 [Sphingomonas sp. NPDC019816]|uniref:hypothetical protein n=1 Tax=Sphingomonas sp. NPDC019816 TaxID=3390679 RepID=UPI003D05F0E5
MQTGHIEVHLHAEQRPWFKHGVTVLAWACAIVDLASTRAARRVSDIGAALLVRYGMRLTAK